MVTFYFVRNNKVFCYYFFLMVKMKIIKSESSIGMMLKL